MYLVKCKRITQQAEKKFVAKFAAMPVFLKFRCSFGFHEHVTKTQYRSNPPKMASVYICGIRLHLRKPEQLNKFALADSMTKLMSRQNKIYTKIL